MKDKSPDLRQSVAQSSSTPTSTLSSTVTASSKPSSSKAPPNLQQGVPPVMSYGVMGQPSAENMPYGFAGLPAMQQLSYEQLSSPYSSGGDSKLDAQSPVISAAGTAATQQQ